MIVKVPTGIPVNILSGHKGGSQKLPKKPSHHKNTLWPKSQEWNLHF